MPVRRGAHNDPWHDLMGQAFDKLHDDVEVPPDFTARVLAAVQALPPRRQASRFVGWA